MKIKLNSFRPICSTLFGVKAISDYNLSPFIDGSCRREPDFQNKFPSITSLCRGGKFAPKLLPGDLVIYITTKGKWFSKEKHYRLVGILEITKKMADHNMASAWYCEQNLSLPSNCMVNDNPPLLLFRTSGTFRNKRQCTEFLQQDLESQNFKGKEIVERWDKNYQFRAKQWPHFIITQPIYLELNNQPILRVCDMETIFNRVPNTQNANNASSEQLLRLINFTGINVADRIYKLLLKEIENTAFIVSFYFIICYFH